LAEEIHGGRTGRERREERGIDMKRTSGEIYYILKAQYGVLK
jgi:hypothetical protein